MEPDRWDPLIQAYFEGEISADDRKQVELLLETTPAFQEKYQQYQAAYLHLHEAAHQIDPEAYRQAKLKDMAPKKGNMPFRWAVAASILLLAGIFLWWQLRATYSSAAWVASYDVLADFPDGSSRSGTQQNQSLIEQANQALTAGEYEQCLSLVQPISVEDEGAYLEARLLAFQAHWLLGQPEQALNSLQALEQLPVPMASQPLYHWFKALVQLELGNWDEARLALRWLSEENPTSFYQEEARTWLNRMDSGWFDWFN
ncbi:MAG: hypothetical protein AAFR61_25105 [Bacteroidota bacterium]